VSTEPILITGVGRRAGLYLTRHFLKRGIPIIGTYRNEYKSLSELRDNGAELYECDFNNELELDKLINSIHGSYGSLRAIIHNASEWSADDGDELPNCMSVILIMN